MLHRTFILRQLQATRSQTMVFVSCVALSIITLVALGSFRYTVNDALLQDAKALQGGDIIISSDNTPIPDLVFEAVDELQADQQVIEKALIHDFFSVIRMTEGEQTILSQIKVVEPAYPLYGEVELTSGRDFSTVLEPGTTIVAQEIIDRLGISIGDSLMVGKAELTIVDVVYKEPDRPIELFFFGPRVFVDNADLESTDLLGFGSRADYNLLLKVASEGQIAPINTQLVELTREELANVRTYDDTNSQIQRFLNNMLSFLSLIGIFTLLLAGLGIQTSLTAFLRERDRTIAVIRTLGATTQFVTRNFLAVVAILGGVGIIFGVTIGLIFQQVFPIILAGFLPGDIEVNVSGFAIIEGLLLGIFVVAAFTFLPIYRLQELKPSFIFRNEAMAQPRSLPFYLTLLLIFSFFVAMVLWQLNNIQVGMYFVAGVVGLLLLTAAVTEVTLRGLKRVRLKNLPARQALRGLFRPRNATRSIVITFTASLGVIFCIYLIEQNLQRVFTDAYPEDAPNVFMVDIQPGQESGVAEILDRPVEFFPIIRGRITAINNEPINLEEERERGRRVRINRLDGMVELSYADEIDQYQSVIEGDALFNPTFEGLQVSILDDARELHPFEMGDTITFNVQGVPLEATITSIRTRQEGTDEETVGRPEFLFIFPTEDMGDAPQTIYTVLQIDPDQISQLQNEIIAAYPNITFVNATTIIETAADVVNRLTIVVRFLSGFGIVAGVLIIISSILATRLARVQEAVYFKVLGATRNFVLRVFALENLFLGLVSALLALLLAQVASGIIVLELLELEDYVAYYDASFLLIGATVVVVMTVGLLASVTILQERPIVFLRQQTEE